MINQDRLLKINLKSALELNKKLSEYQHKSENEEEKKVIIKSDNGKEKVEINLNELQFIRSANNYIEIFWKNNDQIKKSLIRSSLLKAEESLKKYACIFRCHRTSIVNINNISEVSGNSQGYKLIFKNIEQTIPVSRNYYKELIELIK
jgi:DNA-binding LytR/AlgR family response regulator